MVSPQRKRGLHTAHTCIETALQGELFAFIQALTVAGLQEGKP